MTSVTPAYEGSAAGLGRVELRVLGPLEAALDGTLVSLGPPKQRALLALLALHVNEAIPVERLVDAVWPEDPPASARHAVQVYVSRLRGALGDAARIEARSRAYLLRADSDAIDLVVFRAHVADARKALASGDPSTAADKLRQGLTLWRGRALADLHDEPGVRDVALELDEERMEALELRIDCELESGRAAELVPELEELVAEYPAREHLHAQLMLALHRAGRTEDALEAYDRARGALLDELGLEPSARLHELEAAILRRDPTLVPAPREVRARTHVPAYPNRLVGRGRELDDLARRVAERAERLVTLTGAGGIGKTRLAVAAAERLAPRFEDGVWFVDLSALTDASLVPSAIAQTMGVTESPEGSVQDALEVYLADKRSLLVVDNFEHVAEAAPTLSGLLRVSPGSAFLVTSRAPLHLFDEHEYEVPALAVPDRAHTRDLEALASVESVRLLTERAGEVDRQFRLTEENASAMAGICSDLDGLPLAIELAGAALGALSPAEVRQRLERSLELLVAGPVDAPTRQQTMRATIEWSYGLLSDVEQQVLLRLAVFSGGWTAAAAREVCGAAQETLDVLREKGLVRTERGRYAMLVPMREFTRETIAPNEARALGLAHAEYFADLADAIEDRVRDHGLDPEYLERFGQEYENFWAALGAAHDAGAAELRARLAAALGTYSFVRGPYTEARRWLEIALAEPPDDPAVHGRAARSLGSLCFYQGDYRRQQEVQALAVSLFRRAGDTDMEAKSLYNWASACIHLGEHERGRQLLMECRERARTLDDERRQARHEHYVVNALGVIDFMQGQLPAAERWFAECLAICERLREREGAATALMNLGITALQLDRLDDAAARLREGLRLAHQLQKVQTTLNCLVGLAALAAQTGKPTRAARLLGSMKRLIDETGAHLEPFHAVLYDETLVAVRADAGQAADEAFALGRRDERSDAVAFALAE